MSAAVSRRCPGPRGRSPRVAHPCAAPPEGGARLACVRRAASVRSEPGSNSQLRSSAAEAAAAASTARGGPRPRRTRSAARAARASLPLECSRLERAAKRRPAARAHKARAASATPDVLRPNRAAETLHGPRPRPVQAPRDDSVAAAPGRGRGTASPSAREGKRRSGRRERSLGEPRPARQDWMQRALARPRSQPCTPTRLRGAARGGERPALF